MKSFLIFILFVVISTCSFAGEMSFEETKSFEIDSREQLLISDSEPLVTMSQAWKIRKNDIALAFVPGAVQIRRQWPVIAGVIWGGMAISGGLAVYEQLDIVKLQNNMQNDSYNANWYDEKIRESTKVRNGALYVLGGIYIANYVSAFLLKDKDPRTDYWFTLFSEPFGTSLGLTYAFNF